MNSEKSLTIFKIIVSITIFQNYLFSQSTSSCNIMGGSCFTCNPQVYKITEACQRSEQAAAAAATMISTGIHPSNPIQSIDQLLGGEAAVSGGAANAADCASAVKPASVCVAQDLTLQANPQMLKACQTLIQNLGKECKAKEVSAMDAIGKLNGTKSAFGSLLSKATPYLVGAAVGAGAMALMGKKKGGGDNNPEVKKDEEDDKLKTLVMDSSSSSSAVPNIVYFDKGTPNNNGSLGNPAVIASTTTSNPSDAVTVAGITPSSSFGGTQNPSSIGVSDSAPLSRTLSGSGGNASLGGASSDSMNGSSPEGADNGNSTSGSLVDGSSKGSSGGNGFMGGMDGSGGSANGQGNSTDGTMMTGVLNGVSSDPKKRKARSNLKNQKSLSATKQQSMPSTAAKLGGVSNKRRLASEKQAKPQSLVEYMRENNLIRSPKPPQK
jgi:hypothetical protein